MDTIEILETIGKNASLRHASGERLTAILSELHASEHLKMMAATGNHLHLVQELGPEIVSMVQSQIQGGYEDDEEEEREPDPDGDGQNAPALPES